MGLITKSNFKTSLKKSLLEKKKNLRRLEKLSILLLEKKCLDLLKEIKNKKFLFLKYLC